MKKDQNQTTNNQFVDYFIRFDPYKLSGESWHYDTGPDYYQIQLIEFFLINIIT